MHPPKTCWEQLPWATKCGGPGLVSRGAGSKRHRTPGANLDKPFDLPSPAPFWSKFPGIVIATPNYSCRSLFLWPVKFSC